MKATVRLAAAALICVASLLMFRATAPAPQVHAAGGAGIWMDPNELAGLPTSGTAWTSMKAAADRNCGTPNLENQEDGANVCVMASALVYARTGTRSYADKVVAALQAIVNSGSYGGRALALGRELAAYVISADLIDLKTYNPSLDQSFRTRIKALATTVTTEAGTLIECHEKRPNNWGTHCGASRAAVAAYLGDTAQLARIAQVFKGWLGDRSSYAGFSYGDLSWQYNSSSPVGINPKGAAKSGHDIDGVLPDDQRRAGGFTWPPPKENYVWEALQGALAQAVILNRAGYDVFNWEDKALLRAATWLHDQADFAASADDTWLPFLLNYYYGTSFPEQSPSQPGKNVGWTDWTHGGHVSSCSYSLSGTSATLPAAGGGTQVSVATTCSWSASSNVAWVVLSSTGGTGGGTVVATVDANRGDAARTGTLTVAGRTFTVNQLGASSAPAASAARVMVDLPRANSDVQQPFTVTGWALDLGAPAGPGVDTVHIWAIPASGAAPVFLGAAAHGASRPDVGAAFGDRFTRSGYGITVSGLSAGSYQIVVYARSTVTGTFTGSPVNVNVRVQSDPRMAVDLPRAGATVAQPFVVAGWALDLGAATGTGVDTLHVWAYPNPGSGAPAIFLGVADYAGVRPDVGAVFGSRFAPTGYGMRVSGLKPGPYQIVVYGHSSVTGTFCNAQTVNVVVQ